jgi:hypothetical protein
LTGFFVIRKPEGEQLSSYLRHLPSPLMTQQVINFFVSSSANSFAKLMTFSQMVRSHLVPENVKWLPVLS